MIRNDSNRNIWDEKTFGRVNQRDANRGMGAVARFPSSRHQNQPNLSKWGHSEKRMEEHKYPQAALTSLVNFAQIFVMPDECMQACEAFLQSAPETRNFNSNISSGMIQGSTFERNKNVQYVLRIRQKDDEFYLDAMRQNGCAFLFNTFWTSLVEFLAQLEIVESEDGDEDSDWDLLSLLNQDDASDSETLDEFLDLSQSEECFNGLIQDMQDPNFKESSAQTLAHNIKKEENKELILQNGQKVFDTLLKETLNGSLAFYRATALILNCILQVQIDCSPEQYETMVAATKTWALGEHKYAPQGVTSSEEIATIFSNQLERCAPTYFSPQTIVDLEQMKRCSFMEVQTNVRNVLLSH